MANPPFNLKKWRKEDELLSDSRFLPFKPAMPPVSNANYAWILHMLSKLDVNNGIAGFLLANGALNAGAGGNNNEDEEDTNDANEYLIRKQLLEMDKIEAIIVLPRDMFYTTDISVTLWIMNNNKKARELNGRKLRDRRKEVLFVDLRTWSNNSQTYETIKNGKNGKVKKVSLDDEQIKKIRDLYFNWQSENRSQYQDIPEYCKSVTLDEIKKQNYNLAPSKYIEFIDHDLDIDFNKEMRRIQSDMKEILSKEEESQSMLIEAFRGIGYEIK